MCACVCAGSTSILQAMRKNAYIIDATFKTPAKQMCFIDYCNLVLERLELVETHLPNMQP